MTVFQGLCMLKEKGNNVVMIVGYSSIIIRALSMQIAPWNIGLFRPIQRSINFTNLEFFQVLRSQNKNVDHQANVGVDINEGILVTNGGGTIFKAIPWHESNEIREASFWIGVNACKLEWQWN
jgi:hypothetical protein